MLKKVKELPAKELEMLLLFVNIPIGENLMDTITEFIDIKIFKYSELLDIAIENKDMNVSIDVEKVYNDIMFETYDVYYHLKEILTDAHKQYPNIEGLSMMFEFVPLYEKLLSTSKFDNAKTRTIQKMFFENLLKENIELENYEECSKIQKTMKLI
jgi:hypothetical protein